MSAEAGSRAPRSQRGLRGSLGWAVLDQAFFGASNLLLNLVLAGWLSPEQYGVFAIALSALVLAGILHAALFVEPMLVLGAKRPAQQTGYLRLLLVGHALFGIAAFALCALLALILMWSGRDDLAAVLGALGLAIPCVLACWLSRRIFYLRSTPRVAALGSAGYLVLVLLGVGLARQLEVLSAAVALLLMAVAGGVVSALLLSVSQIPIFERKGLEAARGMLKEHWSLSRWLVLMVPFEWIPGNYYYLVLPALAGLGGAASLKASMNLVQPLMQVFAALRLLLTPLFVERVSTGVGEGPWRAGSAMVAAAAAWYALLYFLGGDLSALLYGPRYPEAGAMLRILGLIPVFFALGAVGSGLMRARERTDHEFWVGFAASALSVVVGLPLMIGNGALGASYALVASYAALAIGRFAVLAWGPLGVRRLPHSSQPEPRGDRPQAARS